MLYRTHVLAPILGTIFFLLFLLLALTDADGRAVTGLSAGLMLISSAAALLIGLFTALSTHHTKAKKALYSTGVGIFFIGLISFMIITAPTAINVIGATLVVIGQVITLIAAWLMRNPH